MGRPREHNQDTATALLATAERTVEAHGLAALSVRAVAAEAGTTTRAVYSLFGSKDGLVVALGMRAYELLGAAVAGLPVTDDPAADLVDAGLVFGASPGSILPCSPSASSALCRHRSCGTSSARPRPLPCPCCVHGSIESATAVGSVAVRPSTRPGSSMRSARGSPQPSCAP